MSMTLPVHPYKGKGHQVVRPGCWVSIDMYTIAIDIKEVGTSAHFHSSRGQKVDDIAHSPRLPDGDKDKTIGQYNLWMVL